MQHKRLKITRRTVGGNFSVRTYAYKHRNPASCFSFLRRLVRVRFGCWHVGKMVSSATADEGIKRRVSRNVLLLSIGFALFLSLVLLFGCTYFSLRCQLQQLRADVDQLKAIHSLHLNSAAGAGLHEASSPSHRRSKREDTFNESTHNDTSDSGDSEYDGSGEFTDDKQYRGIWMGTYSRVPVS